MKPVLYWTLTRSQWSHIYAPFAVTSEWPRNRINGRFSDGFPSHTTAAMCKGRFETEEAAKAKQDEIKTIRKRFDEARAPHHDAIRTADREEDAAIAAALKVEA